TGYFPGSPSVPTQMLPAAHAKSYTSWWKWSTALIRFDCGSMRTSVRVLDNTQMAPSPVTTLWHAHAPLRPGYRERSMIADTELARVWWNKRRSWKSRYRFAFQP